MLIYPIMGHFLTVGALFNKYCKCLRVHQLSLFFVPPPTFHYIFVYFLFYLFLFCLTFTLFLLLGERLFFCGFQIYSLSPTRNEQM